MVRKVCTELVKEASVRPTLKCSTRGSKMRPKLKLKPSWMKDIKNEANTTVQAVQPPSGTTLDDAASFAAP